MAEIEKNEPEVVGEDKYYSTTTPAFGIHLSKNREIRAVEHLMVVPAEVQDEVEKLWKSRPDIRTNMKPVDAETAALLKIAARTKNPRAARGALTSNNSIRKLVSDQASVNLSDPGQNKDGGVKPAKGPDPAAASGLSALRSAANKT